MRQLLPGGDGAEVDLDDVYAYPPARTWVRANMVGSADGAASAAGRSGGLSSEGDKRIFGVLRALADVVLVGAGTARVEGYGPVAARASYAAARSAAGQLPAAAMAVVSARLDLDLEGPLLGASGAAPTYVLTTANAPAARLAEVRRRAEVLVAGRERVDLGAAVDALVERGLRRVLCEGGPQLLAQLTAAGRLHELCLTVSPLLLAGDAPRVLAGPLLDPPPRLRLASLLEEDGFLFSRYDAGS
ncbi:MAG: dihydrofolate reductase family protein [Actinomycetota bacterium]|nr:dihydrofolate reductase family protein [Actinomycetota bacterium]